MDAANRQPNSSPSTAPGPPGNEKAAAEVQQGKLGKRKLPAPGHERRPSKKARLTRSNLQSMQAGATEHLPQALDEWKSIIERPATPPSEHIGQMAEAAKAGRSRRPTTITQTKTNTKSGLTGNPIGYAMLMGQEYGVVRYKYILPGKGSFHEQLGVTARKLPSNYAEIRKALTKDRDDLPTMKDFFKYCQGIDPTNISPEEDEIEALYQGFLYPGDWHRGVHGYGRYALLLQPGLLPIPPNKIKPDMCMGIDPSELGKRSWIAKHLPGYARNSTLICINTVVEHKSSDGSIVTARIQNQAAARLLCDAWLLDEQTLASICAVADIEDAADRTSSQPTSSATIQSAVQQVPSADAAVVGKAFVGSLCFDGNTLEASVHWLDNSITSDERKYDMFSVRVATGHPFAIDLAEFQATYKKFANFLDWLLEVRNERLQRIMSMPRLEPRAITRPQPEFEASDDEEDEDGGNGDENVDANRGGGKAGMHPTTSNRQPLQQVSIQSFDGMTEEFTAGQTQVQQASEGGSRKKRRGNGNPLKRAVSAAKKLKQKKK